MHDNKVVELERFANICGNFLHLHDEVVGLERFANVCGNFFCNLHLHVGVVELKRFANICGNFLCNLHLHDGVIGNYERKPTHHHSGRAFHFQQK